MPDKTAHTWHTTGSRTRSLGIHRSDLLPGFSLSCKSGHHITHALSLSQCMLPPPCLRHNTTHSTYACTYSKFASPSEYELSRSTTICINHAHSTPRHVYNLCSRHNHTYLPTYLPWKESCYFCIRKHLCAPQVCTWCIMQIKSSPSIFNIAVKTNQLHLPTQTSEILPYPGKHSPHSLLPVIVV